MADPAPLQLVRDDGTHHEIAKLRADLRTAHKIIEDLQRELNTTRRASEVFHQKWEASEARFIKHKKAQITDARVQLVWDLWKLIRRGPASNTPFKRTPWGHKEIGDNRRKLIKDRLADGDGRSIEEFWMAFYGAGTCLWQNRQGKWMDTIEFICKTVENFEDHRDRFEWENPDSWPYQGMNGLKAFADRRCAQIEAMKRPRKAGTAPCERCGTSIPTQEATGLCVACVEALKEVA